MKAFKESPAFAWPLTADDLDVKLSDQLPEQQVKFLNLVLAGTPEVEKKCEKTRHLVFSIAQDLCHAATNGELKLPKYILRRTTVHHSYRSRQLTTILNKLGYSPRLKWASYTLRSQAKLLKTNSSRSGSRMGLRAASLIPYRGSRC